MCQPDRHGSFRVSFVKKIKTEDGKQPEYTLDTKDILENSGKYSLVTCNNLLSVDFSALKSLPENKIRKVYVQLLFKTADRAIISPLFYQDSQHGFFVEPSLTETTIDRWDEWIIPIARPVFELDDDWWLSIPIIPIVPIPKQAVLVTPIDSRARFGIQSQGDWLTDPATMLEFGDRAVGQVGGFNPAMVTGGIVGVSSSVNSGGTLTSVNVTVAPSMSRLIAGAVAHGGLNLIGGGGLSSVTVSNMGALTDSSLGRNLSGIG